MKLTKNKLIFGAVALLVVLAALTQKCRAQTVELHGAYVSDYIRRGVARADESAQIKTTAVVPIENKLLSVTDVYGKLFLNKPLDGSKITRDIYVGSVFGSKLIQLDLGGRHVKTGPTTESELYSGLKLDVIGNPGLYFCRGTTKEFNSYELRVAEAIKWGFLPESVTTRVDGRLGHRDGPVATTFYQANGTLNYQLKETTSLFVGVGYAGTSTSEYDNTVVYTAGITSTF
jgi:hypothetical protein